MTRYAQIADGVVKVIIASATDPDGINGAWIACGDAVSPGWTYDGTVFAPPAPQPEVRHITRLAFLSRFTDAEAVAIDLASIGSTVPAASMRRYTTKVNASTFIDLDRADTRAGVTALEGAGLLAAGRALVILDAPVQDFERYRG